MCGHQRHSLPQRVERRPKNSNDTLQYPTIGPCATSIAVSPRCRCTRAPDDVVGKAQLFEMQRSVSQQAHSPSCGETGIARLKARRRFQLPRCCRHVSQPPPWKVSHQPRLAAARRWPRQPPAASSFSCRPPAIGCRKAARLHAAARWGLCDTLRVVRGAAVSAVTIRRHRARGVPATAAAAPFNMPCRLRAGSHPP